ncbi:MAG: glycosyltransferase family 4 protein [Promethearchaeota archaeon]
MKPLHIIHMIPGFFPISKGGAELFALNLCKKMCDKGHKVFLLTRNLNLPKKENFHGIQIRRFKNILPFKVKYYGFGRFLKSKYIRILVAIFDFFSAILAFWKLYRKNRFQLIHTSFILPFGLVGLIIKKLFKIPIVITVHGPADFYEVPHFLNPILRFALKHVDTVVIVGPKLKRDLLVRLGPLSSKLIYNGIPIEPYKSNNMKSLPKFKILPNDFVILTAGRLVKRKNLDLLIQAVPELVKKIPHCKFILLGSGIEKVNLHKLIKKMQVTSFIIMPGWVSEEDKVKLFKRADIFIQLSQIEGLSLALLESKAAGVPAIIIGSGSTLDPVTHRETGLLIHPPITIEKIVDNIEYLYQKPDLSHKISENVRREAKEMYSLEKMIEKYIKTYLKVLKKIR